VFVGSHLFGEGICGEKTEPDVSKERQQVLSPVGFVVLDPGQKG
jgi:hypothetical protein